MKQMAKRIREMRLKNELTQEQLGEKLGVLRQTISNWENGDVANIKRSSIAKMAEIFRCDPVWLMGFEDSEKVKLTYTADNKDPLEVHVDSIPIIGESAKRAALYQAALDVKPECLDVAIKLLKSLS